MLKIKNNYRVIAFKTSLIVVVFFSFTEVIYVRHSLKLVCKYLRMYERMCIYFPLMHFGKPDVQSRNCTSAT